MVRQRQPALEEGRSPSEGVTRLGSGSNTLNTLNSIDNFAPRVGAAYQLTQQPGRETVARGGFGLFYDLGHDTAAAAFGNVFPFVAIKSLAGAKFFPGRNAARDLSYIQIWGAKPFADGLPKWVERVPSFNLHRVRTPLMIEAIGSPLFEWEWYAGLRRLGKPVEMRFIPGGSHELFKPPDQYFSQQGNVDWFAFWLKGAEDADPAKAEQYTRWRELRSRR